MAVFPPARTALDFSPSTLFFTNPKLHVLSQERYAHHHFICNHGQPAGFTVMRFTWEKRIICPGPVPSQKFPPREEMRNGSKVLSAPTDLCGVPTSMVFSTTTCGATA